jgi:hypothetical protein
VEWIARHLAGEVRGGGELRQERLSVSHGGGGRRVEPGDVGAAHRAELEHHGSEIRAGDLGEVLGRAADEVVEWVEADGAAGSGAAGAAGALVGGGLTDAANLEGREAGPGGVSGDAGEAAVDDRADVLDGDGAFGDVGGEDYLAALRGGDGAVLLLGRLVAVERKERPAVTAGKGVAGGLRAADLVGSGEEDEDVTGRIAKTVKGAGDLLLDGRGGVRRVLDLEREVAAFGAENASAAEKAGDGRGVEGRGHDDEAEIGARGLLEAAEEGEGEVAFEVALVELVEDDGAGAVESRVGEEAAGEDALGEKAKAGTRAGDVLEADLIADSIAEALAALGGDEAGGESGGEAAGLEDEDLAIREVE